MYVVETHLNQCGVKLMHSRSPLYDTFGNSVPALYDANLHQISLVYGLSPIVRRCVLAHEAIHAQYRHKPNHLNHYQIEHQADIEAARNLIDPYDLADLQRCYPDSPHAWCIQLAVTPHILKIYLHQKEESA